MTKEELMDELHKLEVNDDREDAHIKADSLLLAYINDVDIERAFDAIDKWYA